MPRIPTRLRSVTHTGSAHSEANPFVVCSKVWTCLVCKVRKANCVWVCACLLGISQRQDTDGRNRVSRSTGSGQITPMLFLPGSMAGGHRQGQLSLDYLSACHRMRQQGSNTITHKLKSAALLLNFFSVRGEVHSEVRNNLTSEATDLLPQ